MHPQPTNEALIDIWFIRPAVCCSNLHPKKKNPNSDPTALWSPRPTEGKPNPAQALLTPRPNSQHQFSAHWISPRVSQAHCHASPYAWPWSARTVTYSNAPPANGKSSRQKQDSCDRSPPPLAQLYPPWQQRLRTHDRHVESSPPITWGTDELSCARFFLLLLFFFFPLTDGCGPNRGRDGQLKLLIRAGGCVWVPTCLDGTGCRRLFD